VPLKITIGDLFQSKAQTLVNAVNCQGVMGAGVALEFRKRWPEMFSRYQQACWDHELQTGHPIIDKGQVPWIISFPTKYQYHNKSRLEWIEDGLEEMKGLLVEWEVESLAMPLLGAGLGGLNNLLVYRAIQEKLADLSIPIEVRILERFARDLPAQDFLWPDMEDNPLDMEGTVDATD
jgi:O-acetyl-ADP-ribose deacetylase (regulator of RNase III)